jgi:hypothetical protein
MSRPNIRRDELETVARARGPDHRRRTECSRLAHLLLRGRRGLAGGGLVRGLLLVLLHLLQAEELLALQLVKLTLVV